MLSARFATLGGMGRNPEARALPRALGAHCRVAALSLFVVACRPARPASVAVSEAAQPIRASAPTAPSACKTLLVAEPSVQGVLFGAECGRTVSTRLVRGTRDAVTGYFQPTLETIHAIEMNLRGALEREREKFRELAHAPGATEDSVEIAVESLTDVEDILERYSTYRRQYLGIIVAGGARRVVVSSFPGPSKGVPDQFSDWERDWVDVEDGGTEFWRIEYDVATATFLGFDVNGSA